MTLSVITDKVYFTSRVICTTCSVIMPCCFATKDCAHEGCTMASDGTTAFKCSEYLYFMVMTIITICVNETMPIN